MNRTPVADWQQLSALYERADALEPKALDEWLAQLRRESHPLLAQLEQMLEARREVRRNGFLGSLPQVPLATEPTLVDWQPEARIGPYRLERRLGAGGMAEVWLADRVDGAFRRQVAIKLLFRHAGARARDTFARRFERERDILASLDHPNIARLHDAGVTPAGQPWLALEYVEGETLTTWCDLRRLTPRARVDLFRQVLRAVQHAHANLVIHRDLKPGNILVSADGQVRLLDFGIAKLVEPEGGPRGATELTRLAGPPMTPEYASPEQLAGQPLTTGSDIYSLGVVLYELLCGERPYELKLASPAQLEQAILESDPRPPSRRAILAPAAAARGSTGAELRRVLAADLDAIVLRALAKRPGERYASAEAFAADLDRWLEGLPVEARAPTNLYRARKFVRRHALAVSLGAGAAVALVVVTVAAVAMGLQAREDSARAVAARDFMLNIFKLAEQEKARGSQITARDVLERGRKDVMTRLAGQPRLQAELLRGVATVQQDMGEYAAADATLADLVQAQGAAGHAREQSLARIDRAWNALAMNRADLSRRLLEETRHQPDPPRADEEVNAAMAQVSGLLALEDHSPEPARVALQAARERAIRHLGEDHPRTFWIGQALVRADRETGRTDAALDLLEALRRTARKLQGVSADEFANMDWEQVRLLYDAGRYAAALRLADEVLPNCSDVLGPRAQACRYLGTRRVQLLESLGDADQARQAMPELLQAAEGDSVPYLQIQTWLADLRLKTGAKDAAEVAARAQAMERVLTFARTRGVDPGLRASAFLGLADAAMRTGDADAALAWSREAGELAGQRDDEPPRSRTGAQVQTMAGLAALAQGSTQTARERLQAAHRFFVAAYGDRHPQTQMSALDLALADERQGAYDEARTLVARAREPLEAALGKHAPVLGGLARIEARLNAVAPGTSNPATSGPGPGKPSTLPDLQRDYFFP